MSNNKNIINSIKEAEQEAEKKIENTRTEENKKLEELKIKKEKELREIKELIKPKIQKLIETSDKNIQGAKIIHKHELEKKASLIENISKEKTDKAVEYVFSKL